MRDTRVIDNDLESGVVTLMHYDDADDSMTIEHIQDVQPLIDVNEYRARENRSDWKGELHHVASIDAITHMELVASGCIQDQKCMKRWLNDRNNRKFRTKLGEV